jgi:hypothetical protein
MNIRSLMVVTTVLLQHGLLSPIRVQVQLDATNRRTPGTGSSFHPINPTGIIMSQCRRVTVNSSKTGRWFVSRTIISGDSHGELLYVRHLHESLNRNVSSLCGLVYSLLGTCLLQSPAIEAQARWGAVDRILSSLLQSWRWR